MVTPVLQFAADDVAAGTEKFTPACVVHMIAFGTGDPEAGGHSFNFSRSFEDDWGVCTVRKIQRATVYEGITSFGLRRSELRCVFEPKAAAEIGFSELRITFQIDDREWTHLAAEARTIFRGRDYFKCDG